MFSDFESLVADGVQMDYFRRFMRAMRAIRPLNFYLAVEDMLKCRTYRGRSEKIEYIIHKFFHSTQERSTSLNIAIETCKPNYRKYYYCNSHSLSYIYCYFNL